VSGRVGSGRVGRLVGELFNETANATQAHAAYGDLYPAAPGETIRTIFEQRAGADAGADAAADAAADAGADAGPLWTLTMQARRAARLLFFMNERVSVLPAHCVRCRHRDGRPRSNPNA
jgi:hypothetical protein